MDYGFSDRDLRVKKKKDVSDLEMDPLFLEACSLGKQCFSRLLN
jgi:hypothetical protein